MLYSSQIRAARALLGWRQDELSAAAKVGVATIQRIEQRDGIAMANMATLLRLKDALERHGIKFVNTDRERGVILRSA
jgi:ribosome-binding protein aMBF1 (putative translation factor)